MGRAGAVKSCSRHGLPKAERRGAAGRSLGLLLIHEVCTHISCLTILNTRETIENIASYEALPSMLLFPAKKAEHGENPNMTAGVMCCDETCLRENNVGAAANVVDAVGSSQWIIVRGQAKLARMSAFSSLTAKRAALWNARWQTFSSCQ